jgi:DNA (cytosine-5)-methyltransferase 1
MKDCTFVVNIDGEKATYDFDGFRAFLMKNENLSAVAPQFYGVQDSTAKTSGKALSAPPRKLKQQGPASASPVSVASWFSGTGTVEAALSNVKSTMAVEYEPAIAEQFNKAHGTAFKARDVASVSPAEVRESGAVLFHASPVCKNFSRANRDRSPNDLDLISARAVAAVIREASPPVVTVENVPDYAKTELFKLITDALDEKGYTWRKVIIDAADLGAPQHRKRLIVQAVRDGELPPLPAKKTQGDWYEAVRDLIDDAPASEIPPWERRRLDAMANRGMLDMARPIITMGGSVGASVAAASNAGKPSPTLKASNQVPRILLPNGTVKRVTPRMMARLMGLPDSFSVPENAKLATVVLGNGIQAEMTKQLIQPLLREKSAPSTNLTIEQLFGGVHAEPRSPLGEGVPKTSKYKTAVEARAALSTIVSEYEKEEEELREVMRKTREELMTVRRKRTKEEEAQLEADFLAAKEGFLGITEKYRNMSIKMIAPGGLADISLNPVNVEEEVVGTGRYRTVLYKDVEGRLPAEVAEKVQIGVDYFKLIVGNHPDLKKLSIRIRYFENQPEQRAFFQGFGKKPPYVELSKADVRLNIIVHELGHWLESVSPETRKLVKQFLKRRAGKEAPQMLSKLTGNSRYENDEFAVKDEFAVPYIGKYYPEPSLAWKPGMPFDWEDAYASEVISMGLQYMYENPAYFAQRDPDMFDFIFDVLRAPSQSSEEGDILGLGHL